MKPEDLHDIPLELLEAELRRRDNLLTLHARETVPVGTDIQYVENRFARAMLPALWAERIVTAEPSHVLGKDGKHLLQVDFMFSVYKFQPFEYTGARPS